MPVKLPYSESAERAVLGSMMLNNSSQSLVMSSLFEDCFYLQNNRAVFTAMRNLYDLKKPIDAQTVIDELKNLNTLEAIGGIPYLSGIIEEYITSENIESYISILFDKYIMREIISLMDKKVSTWEDDKISDVGAYLSNLETEITNITRARKIGGFKSAKEVIGLVKEQSLKEVQSSSNLTGITTGFKYLDRLTKGFQKENLIILAARPSMGKTALALNFAVNCIKGGTGNEVVAIFSLEMPADQLMKRIISSEAQVNGNNLAKAIADPNESQNIELCMNQLSKMNIYIDESSTATLADIQSKARKLKEQAGRLDFIVVDYIGLIAPSKMGKAADNRQLEIAEYSRGLKALARELHVPVLVLSQLSRSVEKRPNKRPMLSDLRESGAIEQDADMVLFIYRDEYYKYSKDPSETKTSSQNENDESPIAEIILAKNRNGPVNTVKLVFMKDCGLFSNYMKDDAVGETGGNENRYGD